MRMCSQTTLHRAAAGRSSSSFLSQQLGKPALPLVKPQHLPLGKLTDLRLGLRGESMMCQNSFSHHPDWSRIGNRIFECPNKHVFLDVENSYCHLCREPVGVSAITHLSDRDHHNMQLFLFLSTLFPRNAVCGGSETGSTAAPANASTATENVLLYHPASVMGGAAKLFPRLSRAVSDGQVHTQQDALRRASLQSMLVLLSSGSIEVGGTARNGPPVLRVFHGDVSTELAHSGERLFKKDVSRVIVEWFPALSAGVSTQIAHKCWGRSNLESVFDALRLQPLLNQRSSEAPANKGLTVSHGVKRNELKTKTEKASFMRLLMWELTTRNEEVDANFSGASPLSEVDQLLLQLARRRLAFELVYLQSLKYMQCANTILQEMSFPGLEDLMSLGIV
uniref:Uncharacterized protein n=1 Tax=Trypanosoma congolense (strain IL3000) TaxID=1068625 RepID=G0USG2_TRYCI|nr:conserved hypothetical protein [Trypanosoma congolense IL3000]